MKTKDMLSWLGHGNVGFIHYSIYDPFGSFDGLSMHKTLVIRGIIFSNHDGKTEILQMQRHITPYKLSAKFPVQKEEEEVITICLKEACDKYALYGYIRENV